MYEESESASLAFLLKEWKKLQLLLGWYTLDQIYNIDKTVSL